MTNRPPLRLAMDPDDAPAPIRESVRVRTAAVKMEMDESQIRRLLASGELEGHGHGKRGVRVYVDAIRAYQEGRPLDGVIPKAVHKRKPNKSAAHQEAVAFLSSMNLV